MPPRPSISIEPAAVYGKAQLAAAMGGEVQAAATDVLHRVADMLAGRVYSPRIKLLTIEQVCEATGLAASTIYQLVTSGDFPKPVKVGRQNKWRESTLVAWLDRREAEANRE